MTDPAPQQTPGGTPPRHLGAPVGGQTPTRATTGALGRILQRIDDPDLRPMLESHKGGQLARAIAAELDIIHSALGQQGQDRAPSLMTDIEATALEQWLHQHFALTGNPPQAGERLVNRVMLTLHGLVQQLQECQRALADRRQSGTPVG